jgi:type I restriction enzyme M protein
MLTGEIRNQIDRIWNAFWAGGIANPLEVIEQNRDRRLIAADKT